MGNIIFRPARDGDKKAITIFLTKNWSSPQIVSRGKTHQADQLPAFVALQNDKIIGLLTFEICDDACEIVSLDSEIKNIGIGASLINYLKDYLKTKKCKRLWAITTNDNLSALRFYQKRGFELVAIYRNALEISRKLKPEIPMLGIDGIPLKDEIEVEMRLNFRGQKYRQRTHS